MRLDHSISLLAVAVASANLAVVAVSAKAQGKTVLEEIIVTAQKREESLQEELLPARSLCCPQDQHKLLTKRGNIHFKYLTGD